MRLKSPCYVELLDLNNFGRLVCALERTPVPAFSLFLNQQFVYAVQTDIIEGRAVIYFVKSEEMKYGQYMAYRITGMTEEVSVVDSVMNPSFIYTPIINVDKFPPTLTRKARVNKNSGYVSIRLRDLSSLAKVAAYKTIYDESPLPLLIFKDKTNFVVGSAISLIESDTISYFYYVVLDEEPINSFLRYSSQKVEQPAFSNRIDEHGYVYLKLIRLASGHPLVNIRG
ncbi:MAG: hypothetical protein WBF33_36340 [Candidatus Nitrosopolaris sp.]